MKTSLPLTALALLCISLGTGAAVCIAQERNARVAAIQQKAHSVEDKIKQWLEAGKNPAPALALMQQAKQAFDAGDPNRGEGLVDQAVAFFDRAPVASKAAAGSKLYGNPQVVEITGFDQDAMEPCITLDGKYIFFNNSNELRDTTIFCAKRIAPNKFTFVGRVSGIHLINDTGIGDAREAAPSLDSANNFYYTCTAEYPKNRRTLHVGPWTPNQLPQVAAVLGNITPEQMPWIDMDCGVSPDGSTLVFSRAKLGGNSGVPDESYLVMATRHGRTEFNIAPNSDQILREVNALAGLKYAPSITADGLELYFTRAQTTKVPMAGMPEPELMQTMVARRRTTNEPFGAPERLAAIDGFAEAPSLTLDKKELFFHKRIGNRFRIVRLQRNQP